MSDKIENIFIDLLFPKTKPISVCIFYKPPSQARFLEQIITEFESLEFNNELFILRDFNNSKVVLSLFINIQDNKSS